MTVAILAASNGNGGDLSKTPPETFFVEIVGGFNGNSSNVSGTIPRIRISKVPLTNAFIADREQECSSSLVASSVDEDEVKPLAPVRTQASVGKENKTPIPKKINSERKAKNGNVDLLKVPKKKEKRVAPQKSPRPLIVQIPSEDSRSFNTSNSSSIVPNLVSKPGTGRKPRQLTRRTQLGNLNAQTWTEGPKNILNTSFKNRPLRAVNHALSLTHKHLVQSKLPSRNFCFHILAGVHAISKLELSNLSRLIKSAILLDYAQHIITRQVVGDEMDLYNIRTLFTITKKLLYAHADKPKVSYFLTHDLFPLLRRDVDEKCYTKPLLDFNFPETLNFYRKLYNIFGKNKRMRHTIVTMFPSNALFNMVAPHDDQSGRSAIIWYQQAWNEIRESKHLKTIDARNLPKFLEYMERALAFIYQDSLANLFHTPKFAPATDDDI